ncbi:MAG: hypothetical protein P1P84_02590 [Deferrisomatales bacterium]|nr:hypothetical protein [Deferrisomatales bacterium]
MRLLKQSTAFTFRAGPFVDSTDGVTPETGLTIGQADIQISKAGGAFAQTSAAPTTTHDSDGYYQCPLTATDTGTLGALRVQITMTGALPVWEDWTVVPANVFDSLVAGTDTLNAEVASIAANAITATAIQDDAITAAKLATGALTADAFAADAIVAATLATGAITADAFAADAIVAATLAADCITAAKVAADVHQETIELAFTYDATATYATATAGSLVTEIADNAGGSALTAAGIADAVWDEVIAGAHDTATFAGKLLIDAGGAGTPPTVGEIRTEMETAGGHLALILADTGTTLPGNQVQLMNVIMSANFMTIRSWLPTGFNVSFSGDIPVSGAITLTAQNANFVSGDNSFSFVNDTVLGALDADEAWTPNAAFNGEKNADALNITCTGDIPAGVLTITVRQFDAGEATILYVNIPACNSKEMWVGANGNVIGEGENFGAATFERDHTASIAAIPTNPMLATEDGSSFTALPDVTLADGAHGGTAAVLTLERVVVASTTTDQPAMKLTGNGTAAGLLAESPSDGIRARSTTSGNGLRVEGASGGYGLNAIGGSSDGHGIVGQGGGASSYGMYVVGPTGDINADITGNLSGSVGSVTGAVGSVAGNVDGLVSGTVAGVTPASVADLGTVQTADHTAAIAALNDLAAADVLTQVNAALDTAIAELGVEAPTATPSLRTGLMLMYMSLRNKRDTTATLDEIHNAAGTVVAKAVIGHDGTTATKANYGSGA